MNVFRDIINEIDNSRFEILTIPTEVMNFSFTEIWIKLKRFIEKNIIDESITVNRNLIRLSFPVEHKDKPRKYINKTLLKVNNKIRIIK